jgi:hypothetical protein
MRKLLLTATGLIAFSIPAMAQNTEVRVMPTRSLWKDNPAFPKGVQLPPWSVIRESGRGGRLTDQVST